VAGAVAPRKRLVSITVLAEETMNAIRKAGGLVLGAALMAGCTEQNVPVAPRDEPGLAFDAASLTSVVTDPLGDASLNTKSNVGPGADAKVPNYLDVVRAEVTKRGKIFVLTMDVGGVVPSNPGSLGGTQVWIWGLDTDPTTFPQGEPFSGGQSAPWEFFVDVEWDGAQFKGLLFDRRPVLSGGSELVTPVTFTIVGTEIQLFVPASALGDPSAFAWGAGTVLRHSDTHLGTEGFQTLDLAPDAGLAPWPQ